ncbi:pentatricopeptide repeat-containing protein At5g66520-like [Magnolia sinica]|uniref:pentatricopeptide repeat-containing protein At5g66520-like n=1 Tax=Magnolia sinica TaxID=86752 RepID=UPI002659D5F2|nr:pentatricopeptide repeat-containing protein At5g66520-like [Magnolia sinica]
MLQRGTSLNNYTFPPVLKAFSQLQAFREGGPAHSLVIKLGFDSDAFVQNALVHFYGVCERVDVAQQLFDEIVEPNVVAWTSLLSGYAKLGDLECARRVFDVMPEKNLVSWSAMISGYVQGGQFVEALRLFHEMQVLKICPSLPVLVSILIAIAEMGALQEGLWVHGFIERNGLGWAPNLRASLVHMYMKCGDVVSAWQAFDKMPDRGLDVWNAMIVGLGLHGQGEEALRIFLSMVTEGLQPDDITFIGVLCGCSHAGLVDKGLECFASMNTVYNVLPKVEHYSCVVDLLGRAGLIKEALEVIQSMPVEANGRVWGSLFGACRNHGYAELGEIVGKHLIKLEPHRAGRYVLLANIYASMDRWEDAIKVRELMKQNGVELEPGCSLIEVDGVVHEFLVGDRVHPQTSDIYRKLDEMVKLCRCKGYVPNTKHVLFDISEEEKEGALCWHSEKLAVAFALISTDLEAVIRVVKNLRICGDCHSMMKVVSKVYDREIVIRDRSRFHHFKQGRCSCMDYW